MQYKYEQVMAEENKYENEKTFLSSGDIFKFKSDSSKWVKISKVEFTFVSNDTLSTFPFDLIMNDQSKYSIKDRVTIVNDDILRLNGYDTTSRISAKLIKTRLLIKFNSKLQAKKSIKWMKEIGINIKKGKQLLNNKSFNSVKPYSHKTHKSRLKKKGKNISRYKSRFYDKEAAEFSVSEKILIYLVYIMVIIIPIFWFFIFSVIRDYQRGVVLRLGKIRGKALNPGISIILPFIDDMRIIDMRVQTIKLKKTSILCADATTIYVKGIIFTKVIDPWPVGMGGGNCNVFLECLSYPILRDVIGKYVLIDLLKSREEINSSLKYLLQKETYKYSVDVCNFEIKDIQIPKNMQRSIAFEAESKRTKEATIISAMAEVESAANLNIAAKKLNEQNGSLILRYLHTITKVSSEDHSTIVFPYVMDFTMFDDKRM